MFGVLVGCGWGEVRGSLEPPMFGVCSSWMGVCEYVCVCSGSPVFGAPTG